MAGHEVDLGLSLKIVQTGFNKSFRDGAVAVKAEAKNLVTAFIEALAPKMARFDKVADYEFINGQAHWMGDSLSVDDHLRRYTKLLVVRDSPQDLINLSKIDQQIFNLAINKALKLNPGQAVQYLSQKDADPSHGVALQQIVNDNGVLRHQSHLLPFGDIDQINKFLSLAADGRQNLSLSIDPNMGLFDISGWIAAGDRVDFDQELPALILESMVPVSTTMNWQERVMPPRSQLIRAMDVDFSLSTTPIELLTQSDDWVASIKPTSFWWRVLAAAASEESMETIVDKPTGIILEGLGQGELVVEKTIEPVKSNLEAWLIEESMEPTRTDLVGQRVDLGVCSPVIILDRSKPKEKPEKQQLKVTVVEERRCFPEKRVLEKPEIATVVFAAPTRMFPEGSQEEFTDKEDKEETDRVDVDTLTDDRTEKRQESIFTNKIQAAREEEGKVDNYKTAALKISRVATETAIPIYQPAWQAAAIKDIPEWVWQGTAAIPDEIIDWPWFLVTMFYALLNTKVLLKEKVVVKIF